MDERRDLWLFDDAPILGGAERFALRLARWTDRDAGQGWHARLFCPPESELALRAERMGVDVEPARFPKPPAETPAALRALMSIRRILAGAPGSVIAAANTALAQAYLAAATRTLRRHPPVVHLLHERETARRRSARLVLPGSGSLVAVGENHARVYRSALPGARVDTINVFLEPGEFSAAAASPVRPPDAGSPRVGAVARLIPEKGVLELLDDLAAHPDAWSSVRIAAAPEDRAYEQRVAARVRRDDLAGRVELLGYVEDIGAFLADLHALVVPSTGSEGQVLVILEALAHGVPCVVRDVVLSPEYAGLPVMPYRDAASLAAALRALPHDRADPGELARRFGPEQALAGIETAARRAAGDGRASGP